MGAATLTVIEKFQRQLMAMANPSLCIEPHSATLMPPQTLLGDGFNPSKPKGILIEAAESSVDNIWQRCQQVC